MEKIRTQHTIVMSYAILKHAFSRFSVILPHELQNILTLLLFGNVFLICDSC